MHSHAFIKDTETHKTITSSELRRETTNITQQKLVYKENKASTFQ